MLSYIILLSHAFQLGTTPTFAMLRPGIANATQRLEYFLLLFQICSSHICFIVLRDLQC